MGAFSIDATFTVLQVRPGDVHREPQTLPPQPLTDCLKHAVGTHTHTHLKVDFDRDDDVTNTCRKIKKITFFAFILFICIVFFFPVVT